MMLHHVASQKLTDVSNILSASIIRAITSDTTIYFHESAGRNVARTFRRNTGRCTVSKYSDICLELSKTTRTGCVRGDEMVSYRYHYPQHNTTYDLYLCVKLM
jgi:hypothetical protein